MSRLASWRRWKRGTPQRWARPERRKPVDKSDSGAPTWAWAQRVLESLCTNNGADPAHDLPEDTPEDE